MDFNTIYAAFRLLVDPQTAYLMAIQLFVYWLAFAH